MQINKNSADKTLIIKLFKVAEYINVFPGVKRHMRINKVNKINQTLTFFLFSHLIIWTLVPSISNHNLPLDTIEALAWGSNLDWGYSKHPPLSAFAVAVLCKA